MFDDDDVDLLWLCFIIIIFMLLFSSIVHDVDLLLFILLFVLLL